MPTTASAIEPKHHPVNEVDVDGDDNVSNSSSSSDADEFDFIESQWEERVETGLIVRWPESSRPLHISTKLSEDLIAPLFSGTQWAGTRVWKAAVVALEYLLEHHNAKPNLLELGCGLGVPAMLWHLLHEPDSQVILSDMPDLLPQLQSNVERNFPGSTSIQAKALSWSKQGLSELLDQHRTGSFDICLNCDCIYEPLYGSDSREALADLLASMAERSPSTLLVTSVERRKGDGLELFLDRLTNSGTVEPIERVLRNDEDKHHIIEIYVTKGIEK